MTKSKTARIISFLVILCMVAGIGGIHALADGEDLDTTLVIDGSQNPVNAGNITVSVSNDDACGVDVTSSSGTGSSEQVSTGDISVTVTGDDSAYFFEGTGISLSEGAGASNAINTGSIDVSVTVDENSTSAEAFGIYAESKGSGHQTSITTGSIDVTAFGDEYGNAVGLDLYSSNSVAGSNNKLDISVGGDLTVHNELTTAQGVRLYNDEGSSNTVNITFDGSVNATINTDDDIELAEGMALNTGGTGNSTTVVVDGDVTADRRGMGIITEGSGTTDVVVTGTISGRDTGIGFDGEVNADNTSVTTWKIDSDGTLVDDLFGSMSQSEIATVAKEVIHYIVKLIQPSQGNILRAVGNNGNNLDTKTYTVSEEKGEQTVQVGSEDDIIRLTLTDDKYEIVSAENSDSGVKLEKDDKGFFYKITRGGGILLSSILREKQEPEPEPEPAPEPEPEPEPKPDQSCDSESSGWNPCGIKVIYELDGGIYNDDTGPIIRYCYPGELIHLLDEPVKDGFEFGGWYRIVNDKIETYSAGDPFRPWHTITFTAIWNEA